MSALTLALSGIINPEKKFCCLCLNSIQEEPIRINDEVVININDKVYDINIAEVVYAVFNQKMNDYVCAFNSTCGQCIKSLINCYKFIETSKKTAEYVTNLIDGITNNFEYTTSELTESKSLYVALNLEDFSSKQYYDMTSVSTTKAALRRFKTLDNTNKYKTSNLHYKIKKESESEEKPRRTRKKISIKTQDMILNKNNMEELQCKDCLKVYPTIWNLRNHYIRVHAPKVYKCPDCPRKYGSASYLDAHKKESHCTVVCSQCGKTLNNRHSLKMHELGHHLTLICQDCGRVYKNKATFKKHKDLNVCGQKTRANPSEAKYTCDYCNKKYTQKVSLRVHIQYEHGNYKSHVCKWCGKKFWAQSRLKAHIVKHTREKNFSCSICNGKFVSKESLLYHTRTHTGEKPYKCPHCESSFLSASRRSDHVKRHHLGATIECDICHSKFNTRAFLLKHKKFHHSDDNYNMNHESPKLKTVDSIRTDSKINCRSLTIYESESKDNMWTLSKDDTLPSLQKMLGTSEVDLQLPSEVYDSEEIKHHVDQKVYLEVSDDTDEYIKILSGC